MKLEEITFPAALKLAALAVHVEEMLDEKMPHVRQVDEGTVRSLLADPDVRAVLDDRANAVFLPVKR